MGLLVTRRKEGNTYPRVFSLLRMTRLMMFLLLCGSYMFTVADMTPWQTGFVLMAAIIFTVNHFLCFAYTSNRVFLTLTAVDFVLSAIFGFVFTESNFLYLIFFGVISVTLFLGTDNRKVQFTFAGLFFVTWGVIINHTYQNAGTIDWVGNIVSVSFVLHGCLVGSLIRHLQNTRITIAEQYGKLDESHAALQQAHEQLQSYAQQVEELTVTRERNYIAREIHDTVGHTMTAMLVQLQAAQMLLESAPAQSGKTLQVCEELARSALQEVRLSVRTLREEESAQSTPVESLRQLLADFSEMSGLGASLLVQGDPYCISASLQPTIYRVVQESLTNAKRHGDATTVTVNLVCSNSLIRIDITDNGQGTAEVTPGFGLANMRERISERGGRIQFLSEKGAGFSVIAEFPLQEQSWRFGGASA